MNPGQLLITGATLLDPVTGFSGEEDLLLVDGVIAQRGAGLRGHAPEARVLSAAGCLVMPGLIDMHVHLRQPGQEAKETIATGCAAAVAGGFTTICCMPNTDPALDTDAAIGFVFEQAAKVNLCSVLPFGAMTRGRKGAELAEMGLMQEAGAIGFSDDGVGVASAGVMMRVFQYARMLDALLSQHCEEPTLSGGPMNAGPTALRLGLAGMPAVAEELMIARDLQLNRTVGCRYHVQHISTAGAVELVRRAKASGQKVTAEVTPHHLLLTDDLCAHYDASYKMNPPLRRPSDVEACVAGVRDGTIDCLATDHAPHTAEEKELEFDKAPFGIVGLETAVGLYAKALVVPGHITWLQLAEKLSTAPARILRLADRGTLAPGSRADITVIDPAARWTVQAASFRSKGRNTPFDGWTLQGMVRHTVTAGRVVYSATQAAPE